MSWVCLIIASILEPIWVVLLEKSDNFKKKGWGIAAIVAVLCCLFMLSLAVLNIGPGVAYSILAGIGAIGTVIAGVFLYKDPINAKKIFFIIVIVIGIVGRGVPGRMVHRPGLHRGDDQHPVGHHSPRIASAQYAVPFDSDEERHQHQHGLRRVGGPRRRPDHHRIRHPGSGDDHTRNGPVPSGHFF